jgi:hypothetical protein
MTDLEKAMQEFAARNGVTQCAPVTSAKQANELAKARRVEQRERERAERAARCAEQNAENARYDREGVWYVGGFAS